MEFNILIRKTGAYAGMVLKAAVAYSAFSQMEDGFKLGLQFAVMTETHKSLIQQYIVESKPVVKTQVPATAENPLF